MLLQRRDFQIFLENKIFKPEQFFLEISRQPGFKNIEMKICKDGLKNSDDVMRGGVLACHHGLSDDMFKRTCTMFALLFNNIYEYIYYWS